MMQNLFVVNGSQLIHNKNLTVEHACWVWSKYLFGSFEISVKLAKILDCENFKLYGSTNGEFLMTNMCFCTIEVC